jgi:DNA-binding transcriptional ArsR family regulator
MSKGFVALLIFTLTLLAAVPLATASQSSPKGSASAPPNDLQTKVLQDAEGNVHVLWLVPALNKSATSPGIWYSKYTPNGTDTIPPTQVTNSTTVQSADLAVDENGNAIIVWADDIAPKPPTYSALYVLCFNSTQDQISQVLTTRGSLILWPSLALDNNASVYMTWTEYNPASLHAFVEYGTFASGKLTEMQTIASYDRVNAFPPEASVAFDNSSQHLQIAWGESETDGQSASRVNYAKLVSNGTVLTKLQVAKFAATLRDVSITAMTGHDGAFVAWQTTDSNYSLYVSQISADGQLVYLRELNSTTGQSRYPTVSADSQNNLYVVWYQPSALNPPTPQSPPPVTSITYVRMNIDGDIIETWNGIVREPVISMTVSEDGTVYAVSPAGLVRVAMPSQSYNLEWIAFVFASCVGACGAFSTEESRYRTLSLFSKGLSLDKDAQQSNEVVRVLARKPGLKLKEIRHFIREPINMKLLIRLERTGTLGSFREGVSRRFYARASSVDPSDTAATRILLWIMDHQGTWEAQLSKDLNLSQQIVHYHLKKLRNAGLISTTVDRDGSRKLYRFTTAKEQKEA